MSKHKIILFGIIGGVVLLLAFAFTFISNLSEKGKAKGPKEFNVWVVGDETAGYSAMINDFKKQNPEYANTEIKFTKFSSYSDYEKILLSVMTDGNSPDVFVVNNSSMTSDNDGLLESKIIGLDKSVVDSEYFQKNFNKLFDELVIQNEETNEDGKKIKVDYIKGIPMGYQTLGIFYNFKKVRTIPSTWSDLDKEIEDSANDGYSTIGIGLGGKYVFNASDILNLLFLQNGIGSYKKLAEDTAGKLMNAYLSYSTDQNNGIQNLKPELDDLHLTTVDAFVRGKIGMIVGYPSLMKEIVLAIKRTSGTASLNERTLRSAPIFQQNAGKSSDDEENKDIKANIANYNYFALSKYSPNQALGFVFLKYLSTKEAQKLYMESFPYYLPAFNALEESRLEESVETGYDRVKFKDFVSDDVMPQTFEKGLKTEYDAYISNLLDQSGSTSKNALEKAQNYIDCNVNHIIKGADFDKQCD